MKHLLRAAFLCLALSAGPPLSAQKTDAPPALEVVPGEPATLVYWNRPIIMMRAVVRGVTPAERAERAVRCSDR